METAINSQELQQRVMRLLSWSQEQYAQFQYESGLLYLEEYFQNDTAAIRLMEGRKEFWNWFKNHWSAREESFFALLDQEFSIDDVPMSFRKDFYFSLHNAKLLACEIYPSSTVLGDEFPIIKLQMSPC